MMKSFDEHEPKLIKPRVYIPRKSWLFTKNDNIDVDIPILIEINEKNLSMFDRILKCIFCL
jgi:hypothetical protein